MMQGLLKSKKIPLVLLVSLLACVALAGLLYSIFGHRVIQALYEGRAPGLFSEIIGAQDTYSLDHYLALADREARNALLGLFLAGLISFLLWVLPVTVIMRFMGVLALATISWCFLKLLTSGYQPLIIIFPVLSSYLFASRYFKDAHSIDTINAAFLFLVCQVVLVTEVLSFFGMIHGPGYLAASTGILFAAVLICRKRKTSLRFDVEKILRFKDRLYELLEARRLILIFLSVLIISVLWRMFLIVRVPPNNYDSMTFHLSKVAYWLQHQSLRDFYSHYDTQIAYPPNGEILLLWTMAASRMDMLAGFIQFACYLLAGTLLYRCVRTCVKAGTVPAIITVCLWYSLPLNILESTSTQNDLVTAYFVFFSLVFFLLGASGHGVKYMIASAAGLAVALGTKTTTLFFAAPFAVAVLVMALRRAVPLKALRAWGAGLLVSVPLFGTHMYVRNYLLYHDIFGPERIVSRLRVASPSVQSFFSNLFQHIYSVAVNHTGLRLYIGNLAHAYNNAVAKIGARIFTLFHVSPNAPGASYAGFAFDDFSQKFLLCEDYAYFGITGLLMIVVTAWVVLRVRRRYLLFAFLFAGYLAALSYSIKWNPWASRYVLVGMLVGFPAVACITASEHPWLKRLTTALIIYATLLVLPATFMNVRKPVYALGRDRIALRCLSHPPMEPIMRRFEVQVQPGSRVGILIREAIWDYTFFGDKLERSVTSLDEDNVKNGTFDAIVAFTSVLDEREALGRYIRDHYRRREVLGVADEEEWVLYMPGKDR